MASTSEYRFILAAAGICIIAVIAALLWPESPQREATTADEPQKETLYEIPPRPAPLPKADESRTRTAEKPAKPAPQAEEIQTRPVKSVKPAPAISPPVQGFYVQVGSFRDPDRARAQKEKLIRAGWNVNVVPKGKGMHAVWVGPWPSRAKAKKIKKRLATELKLEGFVIKK